MAMFATGEAVYAPSDPKGTMYGLVQCMRDISAAECDRCLQLAVPKLPTCCWGYQGGVARNFNCHLRIQVYTYYDLALDAPLPLHRGRPARRRPPKKHAVSNSKAVGKDPEQAPPTMSLTRVNMLASHEDMVEGFIQSHPEARLDRV
ncbi:hypothetical protein ACQ4PT_024138 [Festuca glaucescens]